jgi:transposase
MLTPLGQTEGVIIVEDWAEVRRLHLSEGLGIKTIARRLGLARNTVRAALASDTPPRYVRERSGSLVDAFEERIRVLLGEFPEMPATVIAERVGWVHSSSVLRARVAELRPLYRPGDPADRTVYEAGEIVQCDLWFPGKVVPVGTEVLADPPVLTMVAAYSAFIMAVLLPSRTTGDLLAGMWRLLSGLGAVPKMLVWDNESGIGQHHRLTAGARSFAGTLGTRIYQTAARDPEAKGVVERANGFLETSFMPGRSFTCASDYNTQLAAWLPRANTRMVRRTGEAPGVRVVADAAAMTALPPIAPATGTFSRVRLGRDYYVRVVGNDYSVDPSVIGRLVDVHAGLDEVVVTCAGTLVARHPRCWAVRRTLTDPVHVAVAARLRDAHQQRVLERARAVPASVARPGDHVALRALSDYDEIFALDAVARVGPDLKVMR